MRRVAGRPTSEVLEAKAVELNEKKKAEEALQKALLAEKKAREDSLAAVSAIEGMGYKFSDVFYYGAPLSPMEYGFYAVIGVFKTDQMINRYAKSVRDAGFPTSELVFNGGVRALVLKASDDLTAMASVLKSANAAGVCPKDTWIYVNRK